MTAAKISETASKNQQTESKKTETQKQKGRSFYAAAFVYNDYSTNQQIPPSNARRPQTKSLVVVRGRYAWRNKLDT